MLASGVADDALVERIFERPNIGDAGVCVVDRARAPWTASFSLRGGWWVFHHCAQFTSISGCVLKESCLSVAPAHETYFCSW